MRRPDPGGRGSATARASDEHRLLVLDHDALSLGPVALRMVRLGFSVHYARWADEALMLVEQEEGRVRAVVVAPDVDVREAKAVCEAAMRVAGGRPVPLVVIGARPEQATRAALAEAGASWALWEPDDEAALRFVLNGATALPDEIVPRSEPRAPVNLICWVRDGEARAFGVLYSLSAKGAFLEMADPPRADAELVLEFDLGETPIAAAAKVLYTNAARSRPAPNLPLGAGLLFTRIRPDAQERIRSFVKERAEGFVV